ncbi:hypothetical protein HYX18_01745 [Candidatus Woesearchaeota archaeon]|nr:hypothetical protein [Candidatus Woesearchaeota archaeon]
MKRVAILLFVLISAIFIAGCNGQKDKISDNNDALIKDTNTQSQESPPELLTSDIDKDLDNTDLDNLNVNLDTEAI